MELKSEVSLKYGRVVSVLGGVSGGWGGWDVKNDEEYIANTISYKITNLHCNENSPFLPSINIIVCVTFVKGGGGIAHTG